MWADMTYSNSYYREVLVLLSFLKICFVIMYNAEE